MNKNIIALFENLANDIEFRENFSQHTELDPLYQFCVSVSGGYSLIEFEEFLKTINSIDSLIPDKVLKSEFISN